MNSPSHEQNWPQRNRGQLGAHGAPGLAGARLDDADDHQREEADQHVRADALVLVEHGPQEQRALQIAEGAFGVEQLLRVPQTRP